MKSSRAWERQDRARQTGVLHLALTIAQILMRLLPRRWIEIKLPPLEDAEFGTRFEADMAEGAECSG